jgi:SAM-dependent methyltransferase
MDMPSVARKSVDPAAGARTAARTDARNVARDWVPETLFGTWFLSTDMWRRHVLPPAIEELARLLGPAAPLSRILDVGCGRGYALPLLARRFSPDVLIGIDVDPDLIARMPASVRACGSAVQLMVGAASRLDLPDRSVDMIFCHQTMHHLRDQQAAAREFFRVLKPGGALLFAESCRDFIHSLWIRILFRHPMEVQKSADEYLSLLRAAGFVFGAANVSRPRPPWSRPDIGLLDLVGRDYRRPFPDPLIFVAARRPADRPDPCETGAAC